MLLNPIEDSLDLHPAVGLRDPGVCGNHHSLRVNTGCVSRDVLRVEAARPVDAENAPTGLCKTEDGFAQLPQRLINRVPSKERRNPRILPNHWSPTHRFCGGGYFPYFAE
jgi:hypothetical protein